MRKLVDVLARGPVLGFIDLVLINAAFILACVVPFGVPTAIRHPNLMVYVHVLPICSGLALLLLWSVALYGRWQDFSRPHLLAAISAVAAGTVIGTMALSFWPRPFEFPRSVVLLAFPLQIVLVSGSRFALQWLHRRCLRPRRILLVADDDDSASRLLRQFRTYSRDRYVLQGPFHSRALPALNSELKPVHLAAIAQDISDRTGVISYCARHNIEVLLVPRATDFLVLGARPELLDDALLLSIQPPRLRPAQRFAKRLLDVVVAALLLLLAAPVMLLLYVLVPLHSKGPAIFRQERLGLGRRPYVLLKFRTMVPDAEKVSGPVLASGNDPRITRLGRFLRATRLDELPQLINVLRGEMSMVGPRPEREFFVRKFEQEMPAYVLRMGVKPGLTGLAQVQARYATSAERKLRFDLFYICNYSFVLDVKTLLRTAMVVMRRVQAAGVCTESPLVARPRLHSILRTAEPEPEAPRLTG